MGQEFVTLGPYTPRPPVQQNLALSPNPASSTNQDIFVLGPRLLQGRVLWFNELGQVMGAADIRDNRIRLSNPLRPGIYWAQVSLDEGVVGWTKWVVGF
ncbi:MAG: hypothetical protein ABIQ93_03400 [Saprospiraceae bacterium]